MKSATSTDQAHMRILLKKIGPVDMEDVIAAEPQNIKGKAKYIVRLGGKRISDGEAIALQKEAEHLRHMRLFTMLTETLRYQAEKRMFKDFDASNQEVYTAGKFLLHAISTLEHVVWACENPLLLSEQKEINSSPRKAVDRKKLLDHTKTT